MICTIGCGRTFYENVSAKPSISLVASVSPQAEQRRSYCVKLLNASEAELTEHCENGWRHKGARGAPGDRAGG